MKKKVYVEWVDAVSNNSKFNDNELDDWLNEPNLDITHDVGFLIRQNKKYIVISPSIWYADDEWTYDHVKKIPRSWVTKIKLL